MARSQIGSLGVAMAAAPIVHTDTDTPTAVATIGDVVAEQIIAVAQAESKVTATQENPIAQLMGFQRFSLPERSTPYKDPKTGIVSASLRVGMAECLIGGLISVSLNISDTPIPIEVDGEQKTQHNYSVALTRGLAVPKDQPTAQIYLDLFKRDLALQFRDWYRTVKGSVKVKPTSNTGVSDID